MERLMHLLQEAGITVTMGWTSGTKPYEAVQIESRFHTIDQVLMKMMKDSNNLYAEAMFINWQAAQEGVLRRLKMHER